MSALSPSMSVKPAAKAIVSVVVEFVLAILLAGFGVVAGLGIYGAVGVAAGFTVAGLLAIGEAYYRGEDVRDEATDAGRALGVLFVLLVPAMLGSAVYQQFPGDWAAVVAFLGMTVAAMAVFASMREDPDDPVDFLRWSA